jgi:hypothetical protein
MHEECEHYPFGRALEHFPRALTHEHFSILEARVLLLKLPAVVLLLLLDKPASQPCCIRSDRTTAVLPTFFDLVAAVAHTAVAIVCT